MAIRNRRGIYLDLDKNKLLPGETTITTDTGQVFYCYSAGNVKELATVEALQTILDASPEAYTLLQGLIADLDNNESLSTQILANITTLQTDLAALQSGLDGKIDKTSLIQNDTTNDITKLPSSAVTYQHGVEIDTNTSAIATINDNLATKTYTPTTTHTIYAPRFMRSGNIVTISFYLLLTSDVAISGTILTIPIDIRPKVVNVTVQALAVTEQKSVYLVMRTDGALIAQSALTSGMFLVVNYSYVV